MQRLWLCTQGSGLTSGKAGRIRGVQGKPHPSPHLSMQDPLHTCPPSDFSTDLIARSAPACSVRFALLLRAAYPTPQNLNKSLWFFASPQDTAGYATSFNHSVTGVWSDLQIPVIQRSLSLHLLHLLLFLHGFVQSRLWHFSVLTQQIRRPTGRSHSAHSVHTACLHEYKAYNVHHKM